MSTKALANHSPNPHRYLPRIELLEGRLMPALIASEVMPLLPPEPPGGFQPTLSTNDVNTLLDRAAAATTSDDAIVAVMDRAGHLLGVRVEAGVDSTIRSGTNPALTTFAIDGAMAEARTAAFFANDTAPLTSRTIQFISQSTITQREVESSPDVSDPNSPLFGPGFVAPVGLGGHFPPNVPFTPQVDLFAIEHTNRDSSAVAGVTSPTPLPANRFNVSSQYIPPGQELQAPDSYGLLTGLYPAGQGRGIGTLPGGIPLYKDGVLVGGIGVFFPGKTGYATEENSSFFTATYDSSQPDRTLEAEFIAFAAAGGSSGAGYSVGALGKAPALAGFDIPFARIDLVGVTLDVIGPGGTQGPQNLFNYATAHFSIGQGDPTSGLVNGVNPFPVDVSGDTVLAGTTVPFGWLVTPHDGVGITAAQVTQIIEQGIAEANQVRAQIRVPDSERTRMVFAVTDSTGEVLGLYRMQDATVFSIDVAVAKARNVAYYDDPAQLLSVDQVPGIPAGASFTARTFRYLAQPRFPEGIDGGPPGPFSSLNDPNINKTNGLNDGSPLPADDYHSVLLYDSFHPNSNFHAQTDPLNQNGVVFFPGSSGVYATVNGKRTILGGFGVSGDGVDQDDVVTAAGIKGFEPSPDLMADQFFVSQVRLPCSEISA